MSATPATLNPSQTVERIREIIVGRHLEKLEGRVARLESRPVPAVPQPASAPHIFEDRLLSTEARVEVLQDQVQRIDVLREETERIAAQHRQEAQRLAMQIHEIAREKAESAALPAVEKLEHKLGTWLTEWQKSLHVRLENRDRDLWEKVGAELTEMREGIEKRFAEVESRVPVDVEDRFNRIAAAARALAECVVSPSPPVSPKP